MSKRSVLIISVLLVAALVMSACATATEAPVATEAPAIVTEAPVVEVTEAPVATEAPAETEAYPAAEAPATEAPAASAFALTITGKVETEMGWSEDEIKAMTTLDVEATNSKGEKDTYTGVLLSDLLNLAKPASDATTIVFVADDGFTAEAPLADVMACTDCILSFRTKGGFSSVLPAFAKNLQVKGLIEIQVK
jgi:DMSO/TMAO reductase YedYZ molybdopterin-dependent catalytic subunit